MSFSLRFHGVDFFLGEKEEIQATGNSKLPNATGKTAFLPGIDLKKRYKSCFTGYFLPPCTIRLSLIPVLPGHAGSSLWMSLKERDSFPKGAFMLLADLKIGRIAA